MVVEDSNNATNTNLRRPVTLLATSETCTHQLGEIGSSQLAPLPMAS